MIYTKNILEFSKIAQILKSIQSNKIVLKWIQYGCLSNVYRSDLKYFLDHI